MFVFGDEGRSSRPFGLRVVLALAVLAGVVALAARWHPESSSALRPEDSSPESCTPGGMVALYDYVGEQPVDPHALRNAILANDAEVCSYWIAQDPERERLTASASANAEADSIKAAVAAAICPVPECPSLGASTEANVLAVRNALVAAGFADAEVRMAHYVGESPNDDVVIGVPLHSVSGCIVSFIRMGGGVAPTDPIGHLPGGFCLRAVA